MPYQRVIIIPGALSSSSTMLMFHFLLLCTSLVLALSSFSLCVFAQLPSTYSTTDFDSYGLKIAGNDHLAVSVVNGDNGNTYIVAYLSYDYPYGDQGNMTEYCVWFADETAYYSNQYGYGYGYTPLSSSWTYFIYGSAMGTRDLNRAVITWGENFGGSCESTNSSSTFVQTSFSVVIDPQMDDPSTYTCNFTSATTGSYDISGYGPTTGLIAPVAITNNNEPFYQAAVIPEGLYAIAIANTFGFIFPLAPVLATHPTMLWKISTSSPLYSNGTYDSSFGPRSVALETHFGVVAGWATNTLTKTPYLLVLLFDHNVNNITYLDRWQYTPGVNDWQSTIKVGQVSSWYPIHDLSVAIRADDIVAVGAQIYNSVFIFQINKNKLTLIGQKSKQAKQIGFGKTLSFTLNNNLQILSNAYLSDYETVVSSSVVEVYMIPFNANPAINWTATMLPGYVYPNPSQVLVQTLQSNFVNVLSTPSNMFIQDSSTYGTTAFIQAAPPGSYQPTLTGYDMQVACPPGQYNNETTYETCSLCNTGSFNPGGVPAIMCLPCSNNSFCPLGEVVQGNYSALTDFSQGFIYPSSPDSTIFDDIIISNMFQLKGGSSQCIVSSPIFWALIVLGINVIIAICMIRLRYCLGDRKSKRIRKLAKFMFRRIDLVKEGEHWIDGLVSFVIIVFIVLGIWFSATFLAQYPYETAPNPNFACGSLINAQFSSELRSVSLPPEETIQLMYNMLSDQSINASVEVINTQLTCADISVTWQRSIALQLQPLTCSSINGSMAVSISLPSHTSNIQFEFSNVQLIGAFRVSFQSNSQYVFDEVFNENNHLEAMNAAEAFYSIEETLQKDVVVPISLLKVINNTEPLVLEGTGDVNGFWMPVFPSDEYYFITSEDYLLSQGSPFTITLQITESDFYVSNKEEPIVRSADSAFKTLLYIMMVLDAMGLIFLFFKLAQPFAYCAALKYKKSVQKVWDRDDSSDEERYNWIDEIFDHGRIQPEDSTNCVQNGSTSARGVKPFGDTARQERLSARQSRLSARLEALEMGLVEAKSHKQASMKAILQHEDTAPRPISKQNDDVENEVSVL